MRRAEAWRRPKAQLGTSGRGWTLSEEEGPPTVRRLLRLAVPGSVEL
ncbi:hypothetical protein CTA1_7790 [Colletotrichum tanaceti]|uniref:Uncharacterized protein n=1 Tax=Colletotrichum tanaceti TaxID=1306861 RepID=A0A4U6XNP3_9PEZI|nr:hypothetical protein CTA1_7790 [Colletotrichum tanaceti]